MDNILFSNSFNFNTIKFKDYHYTDNRKGVSFHYLAYLKKGRVKLVSNNCTLELSEGSCFYIPMGLSYRSFWYGRPDIVFDSYGFTYFPNSENEKFPLQQIALTDELKVLFNTTDTEQNHSCENIGNFYLSLSKAIELMTPIYANPNEKTVAEAIKYMSENQDFKIIDVAKHCSVSESGLYHIFKTVKGKTPIDIKHSLMVEKAITKLNSTDLPIEIIANDCGFCSAIYFRKVFKKITGKTPSEMRKIVTP